MSNKTTCPNSPTAQTLFHSHRRRCLGQLNSAYHPFNHSQLPNACCTAIERLLVYLYVPNGEDSSFGALKWELGLSFEGYSEVQ